MMNVQVILQLPQQLANLIDEYAKEQGHKTRNKAIEALIIQGLIKEADSV